MIIHCRRGNGGQDQSRESLFGGGAHMLLKLTFLALCVWTSVASAQPFSIRTAGEEQSADWIAYHEPLDVMTGRLSEARESISKIRDAQRRTKAYEALHDELNQLEDQYAASRMIFEAVFLAIETPRSEEAAALYAYRLSEICDHSRRFWRLGSAIEREAKDGAAIRKLEVDNAKKAIPDQRLFELVVASIELRFRSSRNLLQLCQRLMKPENWR